MQAIQSLMNRVERVAISANPLSPVSPAETRTCPTHGDYEAKHIIRSIWTRCPTCKQEAEDSERRQREEAAAASRRASWIAALGRAGIPDRFQNRSLDNFLVENDGQRKAMEFAKDYTENIAQALNTGRSAIFIGKPGTGKTHLAVAIGQHAMREKNADVLFITVMRAIRSIKDTWAKGSEQSESQAVAALVAPDLLILDEVGVQFGSDFEKNVLFDVLNDRYEQRKPTIFLSNLTKPEVAAFLGERVMDRLREDGGAVIPFTWDSVRGQNKEAK